MQQATDIKMNVDAELAIPLGRAQVVQFNLHSPVDRTMAVGRDYWLDMCLTPRPRNARGRYRNYWEPERFERLGNVFLLPPNEELHTRSDGCTTQSSILCLLNPENIRQWFDDDLRWTDQRLTGSLDITETGIHSLMLRLAEELRHPGFATEAMVELIVAQIAIELRRYCVSIAERRGSGGLAPWRLRLIEERLREVVEAPSLAELALLCGLSVRQLTRGFRASRKCSLGEHMANQRIENARQLLAGEQSIKAIAYTLGFSSPSSFCYAYRRATGQTPGQYRERLHRAGH